MIAQETFAQHRMDKAHRPLPVVPGPGLGERHRPAEIGMARRKLLELPRMKQVLAAARAVPEADLSPGAARIELVVDDGPQRRQSDTAADQHHLARIVLRAKAAEGPGRRHPVARHKLEQP